MYGGGPAVKPPPPPVEEVDPAVGRGVWEAASVQTPAYTSELLPLRGVQCFSADWPPSPDCEGLHKHTRGGGERDRK